MTQRSQSKQWGYFGALYESVLDGSLDFNSSYFSLLSSGYRLYGAKNVSYLLTPSADGNYDAILLVRGDYEDFTGDHTKNGLTGGQISWAGFYKNAKIVDYGDGTFDSTDFEKSANHIATIPLYGMSVGQFLGKLRSHGSFSKPERLFKELLREQDWIGGYSSSDSTIVDSFGGNDKIYIDKGMELVRGGDDDDEFEGTPYAAAVINGGRGDDFFDGSSGSGQDEQYLWVGGSGANRYKSPRENTIVVVDEKSRSQSPDIISYGSVILGKPDQKNGYIVIKTSNPDVKQLDLRFVDEPLLDHDGHKLHASGYFSVFYKGVEQVRINPMSGGWSLDGFLSERDTYEDNIRASIAVASMDQLIVPGD